MPAPYRWLMPSPATLVRLVVAAYLLAVIPGPAVIYIVNRSVAQGRRAGALSALGIASGGLVHVAAATLGISALLAASAVAFSVVKYAGAAYLVYLGVKALRDGGIIEGATVEEASGRRVFGQGVMVNVLNPKTAIFFLSFLPQFVRPEMGPVTGQMLVLGLVFIVVALTSDLIYALASARIRSTLAARPGVRRAGRWVSAGVLFGLGAVAVTE